MRALERKVTVQTDDSGGLLWTRILQGVNDSLRRQPNGNQEQPPRHRSNSLQIEPWFTYWLGVIPYLLRASRLRYGVDR